MLCENCAHMVVCANYNPNRTDRCKEYLEERTATWIKGHSYPTYSDDSGILVNCTQYTCNVCNWTYFENSKPFDFCPNCGSKIIGING